jgi:hypothetical protein
MGVRDPDPLGSRSSVSNLQMAVKDLDPLGSRSSGSYLQMAVGDLDPLGSRSSGSNLQMAVGDLDPLGSRSSGSTCKWQHRGSPPRLPIPLRQSQPVRFLRTMNHHRRWLRPRQPALSSRYGY